MMCMFLFLFLFYVFGGQIELKFMDAFSFMLL